MMETSTISDGDLMMDKLSEDNDNPTKITTDVDYFEIPESGKYAYIEKSGNLYYMSLNDNKKQLFKICDNFTEDDSLLYTTDASDTIFYITNKEDITGSYYSVGDLYRYTIGEKPRKIAENIYGVYGSSSKYPKIEQYASYEDDGCIYDVGTIEDSKFVIKVKNCIE